MGAVHKKTTKNNGSSAQRSTQTATSVENPSPGPKSRTVITSQGKEPSKSILMCLYAISEMVENHKHTLEDVLRQIVDTIPCFLRFSELACARITLDDQEIGTPNYNATPWTLTSDLCVRDRKAGSIEISYQQPPSDCEDEPFTDEEKVLLNAIAERVSLIIQHKQAEEEVLEQRELLRALSSELSLTEERERKRLATQLHDHVGHTLTRAKLMLEKVRNKAKDAVVKKDVSEIVDIIKTTIEDTRSLTFEISPPVLHEVGLHAALNWLMEQTEEQHGIKTAFNYEGQDIPLKEDLRILLFQATRELVHNIVKHADADNIWVRMYWNDRSVRLVVEDDGIGFTVPKAVAHHSKAGGYGLFSITERMNYVGGRCDIQSQPGSGTQISLTAPLEYSRAHTSGDSNGGTATDGELSSPIEALELIRVLLADDHELVRMGLRTVLNNEPCIDVIAEAGNGQDTIRLTRELHPDVVVMDIDMPGSNGITATRSILAEFDDVKVIALSISRDKSDIGEMLQAGASGYLFKDCAKYDLVRAILAASGDLVFLSPHVAEIVVEGFVDGYSHAKQATISVLTSREQEVLRLLVKGETSKGIAVEMGVSVKTIENHRHNIMAKLGLHSLPELTKFAIREGISDLDL